MRLIPFLLLVIFSYTAAAAQGLLHKEKDLGYCFKETDWAFGGVAITDPVSKVNKLLGRALTVKESAETDDGGDYINYKRRYKEFEIDIVRGTVDRVFTDSPKIQPACGIKIGQDIRTVLGKLGLNLETSLASAELLEFPSCYLNKKTEDGLPYSNDVLLRLTFKKNHILQSIELIINRP